MLHPSALHRVAAEAARGNVQNLHDNSSFAQNNAHARSLRGQKLLLECLNWFAKATDSFDTCCSPILYTREHNNMRPCNLQAV